MNQACGSRCSNNTERTGHAKSLRNFVCSQEARNRLKTVLFLRASYGQMFNKDFAAGRLSVRPRDEYFIDRFAYQFDCY